MLTSHAQEQLDAEIVVSPAASAALSEVMQNMVQLTSTLAQVTDEATAHHYEQEIMRLMETLLATDESVFEEEDAELLAVTIAELYFRLDEEVARLNEAGFFGNSVLRRFFGEAHSPVAPEPSVESAAASLEDDFLAPEACTESPLE